MNEAAIRRSIRLFYGAQFAENASFSLGIYLLYFTEYDHFSFTQALLLYIASQATSILFDLFGGGLADALGRKRAYATGMAIYLASFGVPVMFVRSYPLILALALIGGVGHALHSNSLTAATADMLDGDAPRFRRVNAHTQMMVFLGRALASTAGGFLYMVARPLPFAAEAAALTLAALQALGMYEAPIPASAVRAHTQARRLALEALVHLRTKAPQVLRVTVAATLSSFLAGDLLFSYYQPFFRHHHFSATNLGVLFAVISLFSATGSWTIKYAQGRGWRQGIIAMVAGIVAVTGLCFATNRPAIALPATFLAAIGAGCMWPALRLIVTEQSPARIRTSALSAVTTITGTGIMVGFLLSGLLADHGTPAQVGFTAVAFCMLSLAVLYAGPRLRAKKRARAAATAV